MKASPIYVMATVALPVSSGNLGKADFNKGGIPILEDTPEKKLKFNRRLNLRSSSSRVDNDSSSSSRNRSRPSPDTLFEMSASEAYAKLRTNSKNDESNYDILNPVRMLERNLFSWGGDSSGSSINEDPYEFSFLADNAVNYDYWSQAYRMLGGYIDCDQSKGRGGNSGSGSGDDGEGCARWMIWASYIDPYYSGGGYYEYHGDYDDGGQQQEDEKEEGDEYQYGGDGGRKRRFLNEYEAYDGEAGDFYGNLNCHEKNTHWQLLGVYRQEFYQFLEQISKHLWAIDEYEYITTVSALAYMTDADCFQIGYTDDSEVIYAGVQPLNGGDFQMRLYLDEQCLYPKDDDLGYTYDDFAGNAEVSMDFDDNYGQSYEWFMGAQEYTLTNVNNVFDTYRQCTLCIDYPTYQDGYLIGDTGTDEDDLINQCWKFHSHDSFPCDSNCLQMAHEQGSIKFVSYDGMVYGGEGSSRYISNEENKSSKGDEASRMDSIKANIYLTLSGILFVACFLAFSVSRNRSRSGKRKKNADGKSHKSSSGKEKRTSKRSKSKTKSSSGMLKKSRSSSNIKRSKSSSKADKKSKDRRSKSMDVRAVSSREGEDRLRRHRSERSRRGAAKELLDKDASDFDERLPHRSSSRNYEPPSYD